MLNRTRIGAYFALTLVVFLFSLSFVHAQVVDIMANKALVQRFADDIWIKGDLKVVDEIITDDFVANFTDKQDEDWKTYETNTLGWISAQFPTVKIITMVMIAEGDWVASAILWGGTPTGGKEIQVSDIDFYRIENGKIAEFWPVSNTVSMNRQFDPASASGEVTADKPWDVKLEPNSASPAELRMRLLIDTLATNSHDVDQILNDYTPEAVLHWIPMGLELKGSKALRESWDTTPEQHRLAPRIIVAEGNLAATRYTMLPYVEGVPALRTELAVINRFEGDRIAEEWAIWDDATLQLQLEAAFAQPASK
jgi:predicted ester cyclase